MGKDQHASISFFGHLVDFSHRHRSVYPKTVVMWTRRFRVVSLLLAGLFGGWLIWSVLWKGQRCIRCEMSLMSPGYEELSHAVTSEYGHKYRLFRYYDHSVEGSKVGDSECIPVLFVPGNCGSYRQVRSFASQLLRDSAGAVQCYNTYSVDFRGEFVAVSAHLLSSQANYVQRVASYLLERHPQSASLILLGHSYGGFILRLARLLQNVWKERRVLLITLASPHRNAPFTSSRALAVLHSRLEGTLEDGLDVISIGSGETDVLIHPDLSKLAPSPQVFYQRVDRLGGNWADPTHDAIVWERGLLRLLTQAIFLFESQQEGFSEQLRELLLPKEGGDPRLIFECSAIRNLSEGIYSRVDLCVTNVPQVCMGYESAEGMDVAFDKDLPVTISLNQSIQQVRRFEYPSHPIELVNRIKEPTIITPKKLRWIVDGPVRASILVHCAKDPGQLHEMPKAEWIGLIHNGEEEFSQRTLASSLQVHRTGLLKRQTIDLGWIGMFVAPWASLGLMQV